MLTGFFFVIPAIAFGLMFLPWQRTREWVAVAAAVLVMLLWVGSIVFPGFTAAGFYAGAGGLDRLSLVITGIVAVVGLTAILYSTGYLNFSADRYALSNQRHSQYFKLLMLFYATMLWVPLVHNVIWLWVLIEATSLAAVFLVDFESNRQTVEATWKYIVMMEVGGAASLLGTLIFIVGAGPHLTWELLLNNGAAMPVLWRKLGFTLIVVGYGIKAGLVPLHTWLPDAHSQAPSPISAMMSGIKINVALYGILRFYDVMAAAGQQEFAALLLRSVGLLTVIVAVAMTGVQRDYKRLFAYSSTENMGLILLGYTLGPLGVYGALLQMINHAVIKPGLFYLSGNLIINHATTEIKKVRGVFYSLKWSGIILILLMLAIAGAPPFGLFISELLILLGAFNGGFTWLGITLVIFLAILFANFLRYALNMVFGRPSANPGNGATVQENWRTVVPPLVHLLVSLTMGTILPVFLQQMLYFGK
ncbi:nadh-ubiquinone oxidoreductase chain 5 signature [Lucifera butyrica]|uniref:Nadh-ubiquinone oxidoreductase chain 5 signature n=1 Tax=Lucifera butyrica TaxID=1351585 RepID=A0A498RFM8_9FIRM|nr:proton-conducting transporter membrane subunit [Lucifera butyrica]VBB09757.1 nadh-ubiquinone oxidoreductase chain 5 signature [Lucifera butyrica]